MKLLKVDSLEEARAKLMIEAFRKKIKKEILPLREAVGRILAEDIVSKVMVPDFRRSTVDGYAVKAKDTMGASESLPVFLELVGEVNMGQVANLVLKPGQLIYVPTGGMIPEGADAMVMVEYCDKFDDKSIAVYSSVAPGQSIVNPGDDIIVGQKLICKGRKLKAQDIGVLASMGYSDVEVFSPLSITIFSSGDELLEAGQKQKEGMVFDINTNAIFAEAYDMGLKVIRTKILKDNREEIYEGLLNAREYSDIVVISGGSSQGKKDMTGEIIDEITKGGLLTHGIAIKPGKPTISAYDKETDSFIFGLPGHPVASLLVFNLIVGWLLRYYLFLEEDYHVHALMQGSAASDPGKMTCQMVQLEKSSEGYKAWPIFGKSGLMTTLTKSQGYTLIDRNKEGLKVGEKVKVYLL